MRPKYLTLNQKTEETAEIDIDGDIVTDEYYDNGTSATGFRDLLKEVGDVKTINLHINSSGGSVFEGIAIYNMLKQNPATVNVYVDGLAASIASVIAMAGDNIYMPENAMIMIHNPWTFVQGNAAELRKAADDLDKIAKSSIVAYLDTAGDKLDEDTLKQLLDNETWLSAEEALDYGLCTKVLKRNEAAACVDTELFKNYKNVPKQLIQKEKPKVNYQQIRENALKEIEALNIKLAEMKAQAEN